MLKLAGSIVIMLACTGMAYTIRRELAAHLALLYEIRRLLVNISGSAAMSMQPMALLLQGETGTGEVCLREICTEIARRLNTKEEESGNTIWRNVFAENRKRLALNREEAEIIESAGNAFFGKSQDENRKHLQVILERLDFQIELVRREQKNKQKVYGTLSVFGGFMLVIFLI